MEPLRQYQLDGARALAEKKKHLLGDEPGLGKTRTALEAAKMIGARHIAVICPAVVRPHWWRESAAMRAGVGMVESYNNVVTSEITRSIMEKADLLIVDEFHLCKHQYSKRSKAVFGAQGIARRVLANGGRVWGLSGTPMPRNPAELWPILACLWPQTLANMGLTSFVAFLNRFCRYRVGMYGIKVYAPNNVPMLRQLLAKVMLRRHVRTVAPDLPALRWGILPIEAPSVADILLAEADLDPMTRAALEAGELPPMSPVLAKYRHQVGDLKARVAAELIRDELNAEPETHKKVIFAYHRSVLDYLEAELGKDFGLARIDGSTPAIRRELQRRRFEEVPYCRVFLGQIEACSVGMDGLQHVAHDGIMIEPDWKTDFNVQAAHRLSRLGQSYPVQMRMLALANTLDDAIIRNHTREVEMTAMVTG